LQKNLLKSYCVDIPVIHIFNSLVELVVADMLILEIVNENFINKNLLNLFALE
jgi:hypothetical protein